MENTKIILASKSPRRQELIKGLELPVELALYEVDEAFDQNDIPSTIAQKLAVKKAAHYPKDLQLNEVLLTADTIVWVKGKVLNKPLNEQESFDMLKTICGTSHEVYTGVCLKTIVDEISFSEKSIVTCKNLTDDEIWHYIKNYHPFDKAGSYGIQDWFGYTAVEEIKGCYYNIMGLPISRVYQELKKIKKK
ncbi:MAG: septum formation protein Maf [Bacteroidia bacterium]|jgi:septum formation protein|nr:septum formation protein Maf [Bacteroidia bacterium]